MGVGCFGMSEQPRVTVMIDGLAMTHAAAFQGETTVAVYLCARRTGDAGTVAVDGGNPADAGVERRCAPGEIQRAIYWDGSDPFSFVVQLPADEYAGVSIEAVIPLMCPGGVRLVTGARGQYGPFSSMHGADSRIRFRAVDISPSMPCS